MSYFPLVLGLAVTCGMVLYVEITLRRERLSGLRARQSIIDRRLLSMKSALERIERRLDAMTVDRELTVGVVASLPSRHAVSSSPCLDCGITAAHTEDCGLRMDNLSESPIDAATRRARD